MGLENISNRTRYVGTFGSKFVIKVSEDTEGAVTRVTKSGEKRAELQYNQLSGHIVSVEHKVSPFGLALVIELQDGDDHYTFSLPATSNHAINFYKRMENINYNKPVAFQLWEYDYPFLAVMQGGKLVDKRYENDQIPKWEEKEVNGQMVWDKSKTLAFFKPKVVEVMKDVGLWGTTAKDVKSEALEEVPFDDDDDDLPF